MKTDFNPVAPKEPSYIKEFTNLSNDYTFISEKIRQINRICEAYWKTRTQPGSLWNFLEKTFKALNRKATRLEKKLEGISILA